MTRSNLVLLIVLLGLGALDLATRPRPNTRAAGGPLFAAPDLERVASIRIGGDDAPALDVARGDAGWNLPQAFDFPADGWLVDELLSALERVSRADLVAEDPSEPADFGLAPGQGLEVQLLDASGAPLVGYRQGEVVGRVGGIEGVYLRPAGERAVIRAPFVPRLSASVEAWLDTRVARFEPGAVRRLELTFAGQRTTAFARDAEGAWSMAAGDAPQVALDSVLTAAIGLYHSGVESSEYRTEHGLEPPLLELTLALEPAEGEGRTVRLAIGAERDGFTFASFDGWPRPWVVRVRTGLLEGLLEATEGVLERAELIDVPERPR